MPKVNFVKDPLKTEIETLQAKHDAGRWWTTQTLIASVVLLGIALIMPVGAAFAVMAAFSWAMFAIHIALDIRDKRRRRVIWKLIDKRARAKAVPLYNEVREKFGDDYHVHLADNGAILLKRNDVPKTEKHDDKQENQNRQD
jgi:hypothetical protein